MSSDNGSNKPRQKILDFTLENDEDTAPISPLSSPEAIKPSTATAPTKAPDTVHVMPDAHTSKMRVLDDEDGGNGTAVTRNFQIKSVNGKAVVEHHFEGSLIAEKDFPNIWESKVDELHFYFSDKTIFNSIAIRHWLHWIENGKDKTNFQLFLYNCSGSVVHQFNSISGFLPPFARVMSFYVPYANEDDEEFTSVLFERNKHFVDGKHLSPPPPLSTKGNPMEMDVLERVFFNFLKNASTKKAG